MLLGSSRPKKSEFWSTMETTDPRNGDTTTEVSNNNESDLYNESYDYCHFDSDAERALHVYSWISMFGILPVCFLGLVANTVSVWVWNANKKHNPMVLLFQSLGVTDDIFLLVNIVYHIQYLSTLQYAQDHGFIMIMGDFSQAMSLCITVAIGVCRWLGVAQPQRMRRMTFCHVLIMCGGMGGWCGLLATARGLIKDPKFVDDTTAFVMLVVAEVLMFVLPCVLLLGFSISLLRIACQRQSQRTEYRKTIVAVLCIAGCTVVSFVLRECGKLLHFLKHAQRYSPGCNFTCATIVFGVGKLAHVLNSSVNFIFYFFFASSFRPLLRQRISSCRKRLCTSSCNSCTSTGPVTITTPDNAYEPTLDNENHGNAC